MDYDSITEQEIKKIKLFRYNGNGVSQNVFDKHESTERYIKTHWTAFFTHTSTLTNTL